MDTCIGMSSKIKARLVSDLALLTNKRSNKFSNMVCMEATGYSSSVKKAKGVFIFKILLGDSFWAIRSTKTRLITITAKRFAYAMIYLKRKFYTDDKDGIRTHACRAHWISSPTP